MKVRRILAFWLLAAYVIAGLISGASFLLAPMAAEAGGGSGGQYIFSYPLGNDNQSARNTLSDAFKNKNTNESLLDKTAPWAKGGPFGSKPVQFKFDQDATDSLNSNESPHNKLFLYTYDYTCSTSGKTAPASATDDSGSDTSKHWWVETHIAMNLQENYTNNPHAYAVIIDKVTAYAATSTTANGITPDRKIIKEDHDRINELSDEDIKKTGIPTACLPKYVETADPTSGTAGTKSGEMVNYTGTAGQKAAWPGIDDFVNATASNGDSPSGGGGESDTVDKCASVSFGFGWVLCPIIQLADDTVGKLFNSIVINTLETEPLNKDEGWGKGIHSVWMNVRTIANASFVLIFLFFIFSNTLNFQLDAYAIKKILPKLVAAAVLVQFSFVLCAVLLDISNITGVGIAKLFSQVAPQGHGTTGHVFRDILGAAGLAGVLGGALTVGLAAEGIVLAIVGLAISALIGLLTVVGVLIMRKIIIAVLIVFSPIALVCMVLPNTEKFYKLWTQQFIKVVLMYPMISALFALSYVLAAATSTSASEGTFQFQKLIAAAFPIICFFLIPMTYKWGGSIMGMAAGYVQDIGGKARKGAMEKYKGSDFHSSLEKNREEKRAHKRGARLANLELADDDVGAAWRGKGLSGKRKAASRWWTRTKTTGDFMSGTPLAGLQTEEGAEASQRRLIEKQLEAAQHRVATDNRLLEKSADQQKRQLQIKAIQDMYAGSSVSQLAQAVEDAGTDKDPMSRKEAQIKAIALGQMISRNGAMDQGGHMDAVFKKFADAEGNVIKGEEEALKNAINEVRDVNFGHILNGAPVLSSFNSDRGDKFDANGNVVATYELAKSLTEKSGDKLMNQTGTGWDVVAKMKLNQADIDKFLADETIAADVRERVRLKREAGQADNITGADLISDEVRKQVHQVGVLSGKLGGISAEIMAPRSPIAAATGGSTPAGEADHGSLDDMGTADGSS